MNLVVETGAGLPNANTYIDLAYTLANLTTAQKEIFEGYDEEDQDIIIINACKYIDYKFTWVGEKRTYAQALKWPRIDATIDGFDFPSNIIPNEMRKAQVEMVKGIIGNGGASFDPFSIQTTAQETKSEAIGSLKTEYYESKSGIVEGVTPYAIINEILGPLSITPITTSGTSGFWTADVERA